VDPADQPPEPSAEPALSGAEVRRRAGAGIAALGIRQVAVRGIALAGTVVLAHQLVPHDLGAVAIGTSLVTVFGFAGDAGIGAGLIRGARAPERADLQSFLGLQLAVTLLLALVTAALAWPSGEVGRITALMVASLPVTAFRTPGLVEFERGLRYQPLVVIELVETIVFYAWAIATIAAGWGVWGLASATPVRAVVGTVIMNLVSPSGFLLPRLSWGRIRGLLKFGLQYQAVNGVALARDQGVNLGTAVIGGVAVLGLWSLAYRIMQVPFLVFEALWRVSFPAMARLLATGEDAAPIMERGLAMAGLVAGGLLAALVGSTPALIPAVFGHQWSPVSAVIPWAALGLMFGGPVSVATGGYLYAVGDSRSVLVSAILQTLAWFMFAFALLPSLGIRAIGIGWLAASIVEAVVLTRSTRRHIRIDVFRRLVLPAAVAALAATAGWLAAAYLGATVVSTLCGAGVAGLLYLAVMLALRRGLVLEVWALSWRSLRSAVS
jgi:polysaccharide transporter, PST family